MAPIRQAAAAPRLRRDPRSNRGHAAIPRADPAGVGAVPLLPHSGGIAPGIARPQPISRSAMTRAKRDPCDCPAWPALPGRVPCGARAAPDSRQ